MAEEVQKRKKRTKEEVAAARQYYLEEKEKRRREREEKRKAYEEAKAARQKAREERAKLREMRASRKAPPKNKVRSLEDVLSEIYHSIPYYRGKLEVGDRVVFQFAGGYHIGEIKEIGMDKVFGEGQYKDLKIFKVVEYNTVYPCSKERIVAKINKEKFK